MPVSTLEAFAAIALSVKVSLLPLVGREVFQGWKSIVRLPEALVGAPELRQRIKGGGAVAAPRYASSRRGRRKAQRLELATMDAEDRANQLTQSQAALATSESRQKAIIEGALDCIIGMDSSGRITDFNRAAEDTFGFQRHDVIGQLLSEVLLPPFDA